MKKTILAVAGVAAFAGIAMPVAGAFAAIGEAGHTYKDYLMVSIDNNCQFTRTTTAHTGSTWTSNKKGGTGEADTDTLAYTIVNNTGSTNIGTSKFHAVCNNTAGYTLTVTADANLTAGGDKIAFVSGASAIKASDITASGYGISYNSEWVAASATDGYKITQDSETDLAGLDYEFTYGAMAKTDQPAGTYTGTVTYIFAQASN